MDYEVHGTSGLNNTTVNDEIKKSFSNDRNLQLSTGDMSFSGTIDPESQQIKSKKLNLT